MTRTRPAALVLSLLLVAPGLAACGGQPAVCGDVQALQTSVQKIKDTNLSQDGLSVVTTELGKIRTEVSQLAKDASAQYSSQVSDVKSSAAALQQSVSGAVASPSASTLGQVKTDLQGLGAAVKRLNDALGSTC